MAPMIGSGGPASLLASAARLEKRAALVAAGFDAHVQPLAFGAYGGIDAGTRAALASMRNVILGGGGDVHGSFLLGRVQYAIWRQLCLAVYRAQQGQPLREARPCPIRAGRPGRPRTATFNLHTSVAVPTAPGDDPMEGHRRATRIAVSPAPRRRPMEIDGTQVAPDAGAAGAGARSRSSLPAQRYAFSKPAGQRNVGLIGPEELDAGCGPSVPPLTRRGFPPGDDREVFPSDPSLSDPGA